MKMSIYNYESDNIQNDDSNHNISLKNNNHKSVF